MEKKTIKFDPLAWVKKEDANSSQSRAEDRAYSPMAESYGDDELGKAQAVCDELMARGANIAESYDDYLRLGFALAQGLGSDGHDIYHALCGQSGKYSHDECEKKWQESLKGEWQRHHCHLIQDGPRCWSQPEGGLRQALSVK